jgi:hypothetical protein
MKLTSIIEEIISEGLNLPKKKKFNTEIIFDEDEDRINFNYESDKFDSPVEFTGQLKSYDSGRMTDYEVELDSFNSEEEIKIWEENWEDIQEEIINAYFNQK